jgi:hypothetical protein
MGGTPLHWIVIFSSSQIDKLLMGSAFEKKSYTMFKTAIIVSMIAFGAAISGMGILGAYSIICDISAGSLTQGSLIDWMGLFYLIKVAFTWQFSIPSAENKLKCLYENIYRFLTDPEADKNLSSLFNEIVENGQINEFFVDYSSAYIGTLNADSNVSQIKSTYYLKFVNEITNRCPCNSATLSTLIKDIQVWKSEKAKIKLSTILSYRRDICNIVEHTSDPEKTYSLLWEQGPLLITPFSLKDPRDQINFCSFLSPQKYLNLLKSPGLRVDQKDLHDEKAQKIKDNPTNLTSLVSTYEQVVESLSNNIQISTARLVKEHIAYASSEPELEVLSFLQKANNLFQTDTSISPETVPEDPPTWQKYVDSYCLLWDKLNSLQKTLEEHHLPLTQFNIWYTSGLNPTGCQISKVHRLKEKITQLFEVNKEQIPSEHPSLELIEEIDKLTSELSTLNTEAKKVTCAHPSLNNTETFHAKIVTAKEDFEKLQALFDQNPKKLSQLTLDFAFIRQEYQESIAFNTFLLLSEEEQMSMQSEQNIREVYHLASNITTALYKAQVYLYYSSHIEAETSFVLDQESINRIQKTQTLLKEYIALLKSLSKESSQFYTEKSQKLFKAIEQAILEVSQLQLQLNRYSSLNSELSHLENEILASTKLSENNKKILAEISKYTLHKQNISKLNRINKDFLEILEMLKAPYFEEKENAILECPYAYYETHHEFPNDSNKYRQTAYEYLGASRILPLNKYPELQSWLQLEEMDEDLFKIKLGEIGLKTENNLRTHQIICLNSKNNIDTQLSCTQLEKYIKSIIKADSASSLREKNIQPLSALSFSPLNYVSNNASKISRFVFNQIHRGFLLVPLLLNPLPTAVGLSLGISVGFYVLVRFGSDDLKSIQNLSLTNPIQRICLYSFSQRRLFSFSLLQEYYINLLFPSLINTLDGLVFESLLSFFMTSFKGWAFNPIQGAFVGIEIVQSSHNLLSYAWKKLNLPHTAPPLLPAGATT